MSKFQEQARTEPSHRTVASRDTRPRSVAWDRYRPSRAFRLIAASKRLDQRNRQEEGRRAVPAPAVPSLLAVLAAAGTVGILSGVMEVGVLLVQVRGLHVVDWSTLMISRHAVWMIPAVAVVLSVGLTLVLVGPPLAWSARRRSSRLLRGRSPIWGWCGLVLGTLLFLGPLLAVRGFHVAAPVALSIGLGYRIRRWLVRPGAAWSRTAFGATGISIAAMAMGLALRESMGRAEAGTNASAMGASRPNLIWIVLDTLRADRMQLYGYSRPTTPELCAWARDGITFDMARSAAPWTLPSHVTMFTGLWPSEHGAAVDQPYVGSSPTLAEHLRSRGYRTAGIVANVRMCNAAYGVGRGFDFYVDYPWRDEISVRAALNQSSLGASILELARRIGLSVPQVFPFSYRQPARTIAGAGLRWLETARSEPLAAAPGSRRPYFLFLNFMDVHGPYLPPAGSPRRFSHGPAPSKREARPETGWRAVQARDASNPEDRPVLQRELAAVGARLGDLYDDCLAGLDTELGRFLAEVRDSGGLANTWVVITADHGEHFGEHNLFGHGSSLYNEQTHVPLLIIPPLDPSRGGPDHHAALRGMRIGEPVSLRELPRTMTRLLLGSDPNPFPGRSLDRFWHGDGSARPDPVLAELIQPRLKGKDFRTEDVIRVESIIDEDHQLIQSQARGAELFSLASDPRQTTNLADDPGRAALRARLSRRLNDMLGRASAVAPRDRPVAE